MHNIIYGFALNTSSGVEMFNAHSIFYGAALGPTTLQGLVCKRWIKSTLSESINCLGKVCWIQNKNKNIYIIRVQNRNMRALSSIKQIVTESQAI